MSKYGLFPRNCINRLYYLMHLHCYDQTVISISTELHLHLLVDYCGKRTEQAYLLPVGILLFIN